ncbi:6-phosphogluconolactonase 3, chloroplastic-like [Punica granatum]|uniref:6-phosphogluconolactonase 3, chloroplastic-like n=2 Tax=Punica granatum TaxID=22663 RepID=A0A6P8C935_PUNGR|nr:6-phosphogluconolactonase 3, chloroplastic-like [Punica granatum]OWM75521.1 hypothetical protein CDL15_Pgr021685 [Punica granatum]PKI76416.1 hypothetical protein CRG98_003211 [Punica granatum]
MAASTTEFRRHKAKVLRSEEDLALALAKYVADLSDKFVKEKGAFTVVLSGGYLINSIRKLIQVPFVSLVDWSKWYVFWVDERVVPKYHKESNYKLAYDGFLSKVPILPKNVYAINDALSAEEAAYDYETRIRSLARANIVALSKSTGFPKFDIMLLSMGPDGRVASLFPGHPLLRESQRWVAFIKDSPKLPSQRITFTFPVINSAAHIAMVVAGLGEVNAVKTILGGSGHNSELLPAQIVSPEEEITWFLDKEAASGYLGSDKPKKERCLAKVVGSCPCTVM